MQGSQMSEIERGELWRRWRHGETCQSIGAALGCDRANVHYVLRQRGGVAPLARRRSAWTLTAREREDIVRGLAAAQSFAAIATALGRPTSTVSREVQRHGGRLRYRARVADRRAWARARRPKRCRLATHPRLRAVVAMRLADDWSPQQIAGWLRTAFPNNPDMQISHEAIYLSLFVQSRGVLRRELIGHLRRRRRMRRARTQAPRQRRRILDAVSIRERPASAEDRAVPGHWEGDLIRGAHRSHVATLVERHSRYVMLVRIPHVDSGTVARALARRIRTLPTALRQSLTWDRGTEMAGHASFTVATNVRVYFCDPRSPWQRGSNENMNGLLRQYFPPGTDLAAFSQSELNAIARKLNTRPRKTLGYRTPAATLAASVAPTP
jgi:IS30 family transposase